MLGLLPQVDADQDKPMVLEGVERLTEIAQLTGPGAMNDTEAVAVAGTDLGSMANLGDRTYFFFGDTFGERDPDSTGGQGGIWRSNVSAYTTDSDPSDGITLRRLGAARRGRMGGGARRGRARREHRGR